MWKDFFHFTKKEKQGTMALIILISGIFIGKYFFSKRDADPIINTEQSQSQPNRGSKNQIVDNKTMPTAHTTKQLRDFDPNTADSASLISLGLKPYIVRNIVKYRIKGGRFNQPEDIGKIYGMDPKQAKELEAYVKIESAKAGQIQYTALEKEDIKEKTVGSSFTKMNDTTMKLLKEYTITEKYKPGMTVNINTADTSELKKIPGVGSSFTNRIIKYRQILGGFYAIEQLKEVYGVDEEKYLQIKQWLEIGNEPLQLISVNRSSIDRLKSHPYINFYQAKAIVELKKKKGKISNMEELSLMEEFSPSDSERISHYLSFD